MLSRECILVNADPQVVVLVHMGPDVGASEEEVSYSYLDIEVSSYGYMSAGVIGDTPYRPWFSARIKLVRASDNGVLMQDAVTYNSLVAAKNVIAISPDPAYAFEKWDDVTADPQKAARGVAAAVKQSADTIGGLLK